MNRKYLFNIFLFSLLLIFLSSLIVPYLYSIDCNTMNHEQSLKFWTFRFFLGTDEFGRDFFLRLLEGIRISMTVAILSVIIQSTVGIWYGITTALSSNFINSLMFNFMKIFNSLPSILYIMLATLIFKPSILTLSFVIGLSRWVSIALVARASTLRVREEEYVKASKLMGAKNFWILKRHILPNISEPLIEKIMFNLSRAILYESFLSFMGMSFPPPTPSLGRLVQEGFTLVEVAPHLFFIPSFFLFLLVASFNILGEHFQEIEKKK